MHRHSPDDGMLWVDIFFEAEKWEGELINGEPDKHSEAIWVNIDDLPENILDYHKAGIEAWQNGKPYIEFGWPSS